MQEIPSLSVPELVQAIQKLYKIAQYHQDNYNASQIQLKNAQMQLNDLQEIEKDYQEKCQILMDLQESLDATASSESIVRKLTLENIELKDVRILFYICFVIL